MIIYGCTRWCQVGLDRLIRFRAIFMCGQVELSSGALSSILSIQDAHLFCFQMKSMREEKLWMNFASEFDFFSVFSPNHVTV